MILLLIPKINYFKINVNLNKKKMNMISIFKKIEI